MRSRAHTLLVLLASAGALSLVSAAPAQAAVQSQSKACFTSSSQMYTVTVEYEVRGSGSNAYHQILRTTHTWRNSHGITTEKDTDRGSVYVMKHSTREQLAYHRFTGRKTITYTRIGALSPGLIVHSQGTRDGRSCSVKPFYI